MEKLLTCARCERPFKAVGGRDASKEIMQPVTCPFCAEENEISWPMNTDVAGKQV